MSNGYCSGCGGELGHGVLVQYEPQPNDAQLEAGDINTDDLPLIAGFACPECGTVDVAVPKPEGDAV